MNIDRHPLGFEECNELRSAFVRELILSQSAPLTNAADPRPNESTVIPKRLLRYWHDPLNLPDDVRACLESWNRLSRDGFELYMFDDASAAIYIANVYGEPERKAFSRCNHPAMRCDYLRMCFILAEGGLYVDADDVLLDGDGWREIFHNASMKVQPLCYDVTAGGMMPAADIWRSDLPVGERVFYVNNDPIAAPAGHPILRLALRRATEKLLCDDSPLDIQSTTGPGNLTAALVTHARELKQSGAPLDFEILRQWDSIAEMRWHLAYRNDDRNWRNVYGC